MPLPQKPEPPRFSRLEMDGVDPLLRAVIRNIIVEKRVGVLRPGDIPLAAHLLLEGQAYRYRLLRDGRRQITAILVPGDACDLDMVMRGRADCGLLAVTRCVFGEVPMDQILDIGGADPEMRRAIFRRLLRDEAISREWMVGLGRRSSTERLAHFICELRERQRLVGLTKGDRCHLALTQAELADLLGISTVHINRLLMELNRKRLIAHSGTVITVLDLVSLEEFAGFDDSYLKLV